MAARVEPFRAGAAHQSLHHFVAKAAWDDGALLTAARGYALPALEGHGPVRAWIVDDTGLPKKGKLSVGVARQYCEQVGKQDNCQVAVTLSVANEVASLPVAYRLYLPEGWAADLAPRAMAVVPEEVVFRTKPEIALEQIRWAVANGLPRGVVVTDAGYGNDTDFRDRVTAHADALPRRHPGFDQLVATRRCPAAGQAGSGRGRPPKLLRRDAEHQPLAAAKPWRWWCSRPRGGGCELARGHGRQACLSLCRRSRPSGASRHGPGPATGGRVASRRVGRGREGADQVLAIDPAPHEADRAGGAGRLGQAVLADRARLRGAEAGAGPRALRGSRLARLSPPRCLMHRGLWFPGGRALPLFPSRGLAAPAHRSRAAR